MRQKSICLYVGKTHKGKKPFIAGTANGANIAGKTETIIRFDRLKPSARRYAAMRFRYFAERLEATL